MALSIIRACIAINLEQLDALFLWLLGPPSGQGAGGGARTRDRRVPADLMADSLATVPPTLRGDQRGRNR
ncbi:hypothetical protein PoB_005153500 [Plakobranchus ocellatus]|uniref:Uncharacterized protein n=1 Tax=Plakobranchus ocellatus TaxID=259542 RepID=A0AAV4BX86_9GAST|nr:hypothetical protein PoB_005153500 [Plakobranchus ocellatus]